MQRAARPPRRRSPERRKSGSTASTITPTPFPLAKALDPTTLVVYEMNGETLPDRHGFPARVIVPGYFGEKHVKWITRIEVADEDAKGFYEKQGWGPDFIVPTRSRIDQPDNDSTWSSADRRERHRKGMAFGGDRGISRVEVSLDDGARLEEAKLDYPGTKLTWALWSCDWRPESPDNYTLVVRATDGEGERPGIGRRSAHSNQARPASTRSSVCIRADESGLTLRAPCGRAAADRRAAERCSMARTDAVAFQRW